MVEIASDVVGATAKGLCLAVKPIGAFMSGVQESGPPTDLLAWSLPLLNIPFITMYVKI